MTWSGEQDAALRAIRRYCANPTAPAFLCSGFAGTGKTRMASEIWGGDDHIAVAAPTGKAAQVLRLLGVPATTLHGLMYTPLGSPMGVCAFTDCRRPFRDGDGAWLGADSAGHAVRYACDKCKSRLKGARSWRSDGPRFQRKATLGDVKIVIADELSMVGKKLAGDLLSFGVPVVGFGDPFQLPPVSDSPGFDLDNADMMLTEVHRQALDSPPLLMATVVREGGRLELGQYEDSAIVREAGIAELVEADQTIVGLNTTRLSINQRIRAARGFDSPLPQPGDKLLCLRNEHDLGLLNGQLWEVITATAVLEKDAASQTMEIVIRSLDDDAAAPIDVRVPADFFLSPSPNDDLPWFRRRGFSEFTFGWALTAHKAQGSEFDSVVLVDESRFFRRDAARHLYTSLTRTKKKITVILP